MGHTVRQVTIRHLKVLRSAHSDFDIKKPVGTDLFLGLNRPHQNSFNNHIDPGMFSLSFCLVDDTIRLVTATGGGAPVAKQDIHYAFRLISVRPADWHPFGFKVKKYYFFDFVLPFECKSCPCLFRFISDAVHWMVAWESRCHSISHFVDDIFIMGRPNCNEYEAAVQVMMNLCEKLGVSLLLKRLKAPSHNYDFSRHPN